MSLARLVAAIVLVAGLIVGVLWWRAGVPPASGPAPDAGATGRPAGDSSSRGSPPPAGTPAGGAANAAPFAPLERAVRAEIAGLDPRTRLPAAVVDRLVAADVAGAVSALRPRADDESTLGLAAIADLCGARPGEATLGVADARGLMAPGVDAATLAAVEASVAAQREWAGRFRAGCESAGMTKGGAMRADLMGRVQRCAAAGQPECLARAALAVDTDTPEQRAARLRGPAMLGSARAQEALLATLEAQWQAAPPASRGALENEARVWRESIAKLDPEYRAAFMGCYARDCDPASADAADVRRTLESAASDGSIAALLTLATPERATADAGVTGARAPYVNPSEADAYAWKSVAERLAREGCLGFWPTWAGMVGASEAASRQLRPSELGEAERLADQYWQGVGRAAAAHRDCAVR